MLAFLLLLAVVLVVGGVAALAIRSKSAYDRSNELLPGVPTNAPSSWAGSHDPEARLHRRLRDALAALRANQDFDHDGTMIDLRVDLEQQAVALDDQLIATAALPKNLRSEPLARLTAAVESIERAVADLATSSVAETEARLNRALEDVRTRTGLVAQARAALDDLDRTDPLPGASASAPPPPTQSLPPIPGPATAPDRTPEWWDSAPSTDPPEEPGTATR